jgi:hypothetical protein
MKTPGARGVVNDRIFTAGQPAQRIHVRALNDGFAELQLEQGGVMQVGTVFVHTDTLRKILGWLDSP